MARLCHLPHTTPSSWNWGVGGRCWCFRFPEHLPLSHHLMVPYCCPDSEPHMGFSNTTLLFQEQATWGVHESPRPPARLLAHGCDQGWVQKETVGCCWAQALPFDCRWQARQLEHHTSPETNLTVEHFLFRSGSLCRKEDDSREGSHRGGKHSQEL